MVELSDGFYVYGFKSSICAFSGRGFITALSGIHFRTFKLYLHIAVYVSTRLACGLKNQFGGVSSVDFYLFLNR